MSGTPKTLSAFYSEHQVWEKGSPDDSQPPATIENAKAMENDDELEALFLLC